MQEWRRHLDSADLLTCAADCGANRMPGVFTDEHTRNCEFHPSRRCPFTYKDEHCRCTSFLPECNKTWSECEERDNIARWPAMGSPWWVR